MNTANTFHKGDSVKGQLMGVAFTGTVRSVRQNERTKDLQIEVDRLCYAILVAGSVYVGAHIK